MIIKNTYSEKDIVGYHNFINLLVNYTKNNFVKYRPFVLVFSLVRTAYFVHNFSDIIIFLFNNIRFFLKMKNKKRKKLLSHQ